MNRCIVRRQLNHTRWRLCSALIGPVVFVFLPSLITAMTQVESIDQYNDAFRDPAVLCILDFAPPATTLTNHRRSIELTLSLWQSFRRHIALLQGVGKSRGMECYTLKMTSEMTGTSIGLSSLVSLEMDGRIVFRVCLSLHCLENHIIQVVPLTSRWCF